MKYDVFISYCRNDKAVVLPYVKQISEAVGRNCWIDLKGIESGVEFEEVIIKAIDDCQVVLFMLSDSSLHSNWTKREVIYAEGEGKRIVPVLVDGEQLRGWFKFHFGNVDFIDIRSEEQIEKLVSNLRTWLGVEEEEARRKAAEEEARRIAEEKEAKRVAVEIEIKEKVKEYVALVSKEVSIINDIYAKNKSIDKIIKKCPICDKETSLLSQFCNQCGWQFPRLYGVDCCDVPPQDESQLEIARTIWKRSLLANEQTSKERPSIESPVEQANKVLLNRSETKSGYKTQGIQTTNLVPIVENDKWGFADSDSNEIIIPCEWNFADKFNEGMARVKNDEELWGYIDTKGTLVIPCKWNSAWNFKKGLAKVQNRYKDYGYITTIGKEIIPCRWEYIDTFVEGLARVKDLKGKFGFINRTGEIVISCNWVDAYSFKNNLAIVQGDDGIWKTINRKGIVVSKESK